MAERTHFMVGGGWWFKWSVNDFDLISLDCCICHICLQKHQKIGELKSSLTVENAKGKQSEFH